ncbi:hypothetical protein H2200_004771 [Cladophialophora chaetospira]|uniref:DUF6590 domain-containing protein n=1 Tax=Cladophialophora chaetospira TaxID=386627 RepID=A0AA38XEI4_9EURO|nr:hypothetical protein H2200_004771 [Cladophialophora chaetospira]
MSTGRESQSGIDWDGHRIKLAKASNAKVCEQGSSSRQGAYSDLVLSLTSRYQVQHILSDLGLNRATRGRSAQPGLGDVVVDHRAEVVGHSLLPEGQLDHSANVNAITNQPERAEVTLYQPGRYGTEHGATYSIVCDEEDLFTDLNMPPDPSLTHATSMAAKAQLVDEAVSRTAIRFQQGLIIATIEPKQKPECQSQSAQLGTNNQNYVRLWLVVYTLPDCCFCVRIRTYQGHGIKHLKVDRTIQALHEDETARREQIAAIDKDIKAHVVVYPAEEREPYRDPEEPFMCKEPLAVILKHGLDHEIVDRMSRACFTRLYRFRYDDGPQVAVVGHLEKPSVPFMVRYAEQLVGEYVE